MRLYFSYYCLPVTCFPHSVLLLLSLFSAFCIMRRTAGKVQLEEQVVAMSDAALRWYECARSDQRLVTSCSACIVQQAKLQVRGRFYQQIPYFLLFFFRSLHSCFMKTCLPALCCLWKSRIGSQQ